MTPYTTYDLHLHTWWSFDGLLAPERLFQVARDKGVRYLAITEHHHLDSWPELEQIHRSYPEIQLIRSAEISASTSVGNMDFLCYNLPPPEHPEMSALYQRYHNWQRDAGTALRNGLTEIGIPFSQETHQRLLESYRPRHTVQQQGLTHFKGVIIKNFLIQQGHADDDDEAGQILHKARLAGHYPRYPSVTDLVNCVHRAGGLVVIAHPYHYFNGNDLYRMDLLREECQLDGIECAHPRGVPTELSPFYREYCTKHQLVSTAGSDTHDETHINETFGRHNGKPEWLEEFLQRVQPVDSNFDQPHGLT